MSTKIIKTIRYRHFQSLRFLVFSLCLISNFSWLFLVFEIRKSLNLRRILVTPKIFLKIDIRNLLFMIQISKCLYDPGVKVGERARWQSVQPAVLFYPI